jgi:hypothetical protein
MNTKSEVSASKKGANKRAFMPFAKMTAKKKGNLLEEAVAEIEENLIRKYAVPGNSDITITPNYKYQLPDGAPREVDIHILVTNGTHYEEVYIYECKNWKKTITPVEIAYLEKKVEECGATTGFLVGKKFTKGAILEARKNRRMKLVKAKELTADPSKLISASTHYFITPVTVALRFISDNGEIIPIIPGVRLQGPDGVIIDERTFADQLFRIDRAVQETIHDIIEKRSLGINNVHKASSLDIIAPNSFVYQGREIRRIEIEIVFDYYYTEAILISHFDLETRGRILKKVLIRHDGTELPITIYEK